MLIYLTATVAAFVWLLRMLRSDRLSLGLPVAYLASLFVQHLPGTLVDWSKGETTDKLQYTEIGMKFMTIGVISFVVGVWLARQSDATAVSAPVAVGRRRFWLFCFAGGMFTTILVYPFVGEIPTLGNTVLLGCGIWMFGVMMGLRDALQRKKLRSGLLWCLALAVYPVLMLVNAGFLSVGSQSALDVVSSLTISARKLSRVLFTMAIVVYLGLTLFGNYFQARDNLRAAVWQGGNVSQRVGAVLDIARNFTPYDPSNELVNYAFELRLDQNYFIGLAADRLERGEVKYLSGSSLYYAAIALIPRSIWPGKPEFGGSQTMVADTTGLYLNEHTAWGVGSVMELEINFGMIGVIVGLLILGWTIGTLDRKAAIADASGNLSTAVLYFLPVTALAQPMNSMAELVGGAVSATAAAYGWKLIWDHWVSRISLSSQKG